MHYFSFNVFSLKSFHFYLLFVFHINFRTSYLNIFSSRLPKILFPLTSSVLILSTRKTSLLLFKIRLSTFKKLVQIHFFTNTAKWNSAIIYFNIRYICFRAIFNAIAISELLRLKFLISTLDPHHAY